MMHAAQHPPGNHTQNVQITGCKAVVIETRKTHRPLGS